MKRFYPTGIALVIGLVLGALLFRGSGDRDRDHDGKASSSDGRNSTADEIWTCSMHPQVKAPKPGLCPICAMDLIPLSAMGGGDGERSFSMSKAARALANIQTTEVVREHPEAEIRLFGKIVYDETSMRTVAARFPARIDRLFVDYTGIAVEEGDHLATVYSPDLLAAQKELLTARKFDNAGALSASRDKLRLWGFSEGKIGEIESSGKVSDRLTIDAPVGGIVTHKNVNEGDYVETGTPFFRIADLSDVWVLLKAYESDMPWLRFGQEVTFTTESIPGKAFHGRISFLSPELESATRTVAVRVNVDNAEGLLKPGMFVSGTVRATVAGAGRVLDPSLEGKWISPMHPEVVKDGPGKCDICGMELVPAEELGYVAERNQGKPPLVVPANAVLHTGKRSIVYVELPDTEEPTYEGREVLLGPRAGDVYIVEAGLKPGERVVSEGGFVIDSALQIQAKKSMMLPGDGDGGRLFPEADAPDDFLTEVDRLLENYYEMQEALAGDALDRAKAASDRLVQKLEGIETGTLPPASAETWEELAERMKESAGLLRTAETMPPFRTQFQDLTLLVDELLRRFGTRHLPAYLHYCPMAFDDAGATWLQPDRNLLNPYFGAEMLRCGEVKEQLVEAKPVALDEEGTRAVSETIGAYFAVQQALAADSIERASSAAGALVERSSTLGEIAATLPEAAFLLHSTASSLKSSAEDIANQDTLALQRAAFKGASRAAESLVSVFGQDLEETVFRAHCPMAFNETGADWLQPGREILNPYLGSKMPKCGEIEAQLSGPEGDGNGEAQGKPGVPRHGHPAQPGEKTK